jgi:hypothetical protein
MADASIWFDFLNTHAPDTAYGFYRRAGFTLVSDEPRVTHRLFVRCNRLAASGRECYS